MDIPPVPPNTPVIGPVNIDTPIPHATLGQGATWDLVLDDKENCPPTETTPRASELEERIVWERLGTRFENLRVREPEQENPRPLQPRRAWQPREKTRRGRQLPLGELRNYNNQAR